MFIFTKTAHMTKNNQIYKCNICGNIVNVLHQAGGELVCCGKPMNIQAENTQDAATEKHVPIISQTEKGIKIKVGDVLHPMDDDHYIEWIEIFKEKGKVVRIDLKTGDTPEVEICCKTNLVQVRAYCNLHGLWKAKI